MALTVGELHAILKVDDRAVRPALRRAEQALRQSGQRMGSEASRSGRQSGQQLADGVADGTARVTRDAAQTGQQAGQQLGQGLIRGADGQWRNMRGELVDAVTAAAAEAEAQAHRAGQQTAQRFGDGVGTGARGAGDGLTDGVRRGGDEAARAARDSGDQAGEGFMSRMRSSASGGVSELAGNIRSGLAGKLGLAAVGAAAGAALMAGISTAMEQGQVTGRLAAQLGATGPEAQRYGHVAGQMYAAAVTEDFQGAADAISATMRAGIAPPGATEAQLQSLATKVHDVSETFELDLGQAANAAGQMIKTGLVKNGDQALDVLTRGLQKMGPRADDIADTFNEYSVIFQRLGIDAKTATGMMSQGLKAGARDTDVVADALKEFVIEGVAGSDKIVNGFKAIGLNSDTMIKKLSKGGPEATEALQKTLDTLRKMEDPVKRDAAATDLFGTKAEDLQGALEALDPSTAADALGKVGGAADEMGNTIRDNAGTKLEAFKRGMQQKLVDYLGGTVIPGLQTAKQKIGKYLGGIWDEAGKDGAKGADRVVSFFEILGQRLLDKAGELAPKAIEAIAGLGQKAADYIMANPMQVLKITAIAAAIIMAIAFLPELVAAGISATVGLIVAGFVGQLVTVTNEKLPEWWDSFTDWISSKASAAGSWMAGLGLAIALWFGGLWSTYVSGPVSRTWDSFLTTVRGLPGRVIGALAALGSLLAGKANESWQRFKDAAAAKATAFVTWIAGLPKRISSGIGSLGSLLYTKGVNVVQGLWNGISAMGGWIRSKLIGWAKAMIPGPIAKALGINSPSKVTKAQGQWIARGLVDGLTGSEKQIKAAATKLSDIVADGLKPGTKRSKALATVSSGTKKLLKLASQEQKVADKLKAATKKLNDQIAARDKLVDSVKKGVLEGADITKQDTGGWTQTADTILAQLRQDTAAAQAFAKNLAELKKKGVRADLISQIAEAGVTQGGATAAALANASSAQIKAINSQQSALVTAAGKAGTTAGDAMYGAGIAAAQGLVKGLQKEQKSIEAQMLKIAKSMSKSIKKALGIKSPSKVMALVGQYTAQGLVKGVESERSAVNQTMASLVETPAPGSWDLASSRARAAASERVVLELRSSGRAEDDYLVERLRRGVRKKGGGDVDLVLAGRRSG
ncbi:phage tail tape measure protein [Streptomyces cyslabdanicus]|uniref:phage tail tape measure protein n=1 Tax=Streptomyces cyslabdanicus TaxID=1470456 RepID=UPI004044711C